MDLTGCSLITDTSLQRLAQAISLSPPHTGPSRKVCVCCILLLHYIENECSGAEMYIFVACGVHNALVQRCDGVHIQYVCVACVYVIYIHAV